MGSPLLDVIAKNSDGRIVSVRYRKANGALGIYTLLCLDWRGVCKRDWRKVDALTDFALSGIAGEIGQTLDEVRAARDAVLISLTKSINGEHKRSGEYTEPVAGYEDVPGIRRHREDASRVYVQGIKIRYHHLEDGTPDDKPAKVSRPKTIAKDAIKRGLSGWNFKRLSGGTVVRAAADGEVWEAAPVGVAQTSA